MDREFLRDHLKQGLPIYGKIAKAIVTELERAEQIELTLKQIVTQMSADCAYTMPGLVHQAIGLLRG